MINLPPNPFVIKDGFFAAFQFMSKKGNSSQLFNLNLNGFWDSCWIVFLCERSCINISFIWN